MASEQEDAARWRQYVELQNATERLAQIRKEVKLMVTAPLGELFFAIRDNCDILATVDLSTYPEKPELIERQREMATLQKRISVLVTDLKAAGMSLPLHS